jgi:hypothetical protein
MTQEAPPRMLVAAPLDAVTGVRRLAAGAGRSRYTRHRTDPERGHPTI